MKIAICDDCLEDIEYLKKLIQASKMCPANVEFAEFAEFASGEDLLSSHSNFDAIFLDMQMEGMDGKEIAREIRKRDSNVVLSFYSAFTENAHNVLDFRPLKYLLILIRYSVRLSIKTYHLVEKAVWYGLYKSGQKN